MRIIPKNTNQKNTVWKWYSLRDIIVALCLFLIVFLLFIYSSMALAIALCVVFVILMIPTQDGIMYEIVISTIAYLFSRKKFTSDKAKSARAKVSTLFSLKEISESGLLTYDGGWKGRIIELGEKNFALESGDEQNRDIDMFALALKEINLNMQADLISVRRPINLDYQENRIRKMSDNEEDPTKKNILDEELGRLETVNKKKKKCISYFCLVIYSKNEANLENTAINIASQITSCGLRTKILDGHEAAVFIKYTTTAKVDEKKIRKTPLKDIVDDFMPGEVTFKANTFKQGKTEGTMMAIGDYPLHVKNAWLCDIFNIENSKVVMHLIPYDKQKAIRSIDKSIQESSAKRATAEKSSEAIESDTHIETLQNLLQSLQNDNEILFNTTIIVTGYGKDVRKNLRRVLQTRNFKVSALYGQQKQAYICSLPPPDYPLKKIGRGINSTTLAACFPFVKTYSLDRNGSYLGTCANTPFLLDMWKRDGGYQNSNAMVIGMSGSGKSYFMKSLLCNEWAQGTRIMILDPENEYEKMTWNMGGNVLDVASGAQGRINPFHIYSTLSEDGSPASFALTFDTHLKTLESFYKIVMEGASMEVLEQINALTIEMYKKNGIDETLESLDIPAENYPTFTDLMNILHEKQEDTTDETAKKELRYCELYLNKFVDGRYADLWNGPSTITADHEVIDFTFQSLFANKNNTVANAQMLLLFGFLEQEIINTRIRNNTAETQRTIILVDEAHLFIDVKYPIALDFFYSMCKRIRKYDGSFIAATQSVADWNANEDLNYKTTAILKNSQYTFVFKLAPPDMKDLKDLYEAGSGFNDEEQNRIITAGTGEVFFIGSTSDRYCVKVETGEYARSLFSSKIDDAGAQALTG